jgi:hypothetical protein
MKEERSDDTQASSTSASVKVVPTEPRRPLTVLEIEVRPVPPNLEQTSSPLANIFPCK